MKIPRLLPLALASGLAAAPATALAQETVMERLAEVYAPPGTFYLSGSDDREIVRYSQPRDLTLCLPRNPRQQDVAVTVKWDSYSGVLYPGNCLFFDARRVSVSPATELPSGVILEGTIASRR